jgi:hypothetical protein
MRFEALLLLELGGAAGGEDAGLRTGAGGQSETLSARLRRRILLSRLSAGLDALWERRMIDAAEAAKREYRRRKRTQEPVSVGAYFRILDELYACRSQDELYAVIERCRALWKPSAFWEDLLETAAQMTVLLRVQQRDGL